MKKIILAVCLMFLMAGLGGCTLTDTKVQGNSGHFYREAPVLTDVIATTTSSAINIKSAKRVTLFIDNTPSAAGYATTTYAVTASVDGDNFVTYNKLIDNVTNTNAQGLTRIASKNSSTDQNLLLSMDLENDIFQSFKVTATIALLTGTTISTSTVTAYIEY